MNMFLSLEKYYYVVEIIHGKSSALTNLISLLQPLADSLTYTEKKKVF